jgi:transposase
MTTSSSPVRERRDIKALEKRRIKAGNLFARGFSQAEIARRLKVSRAAVHYWHNEWEKSGVVGLESKRGVFGRAPRLTEVKIKKVRAAIIQGPRKAGYATDMWTLARIAKVIKVVASVSYHPNHVWRVLHAMGFTCQKPSTKPKERNEKAIKRWKETAWPIMQKRGPKAMPV